MAAFAVLIASAGGLGRLRPMPGTIASAATMLPAAALLAWHPPAVSVAAALAALGGWWAIRAVRPRGDPGWVVIDEVAGQLVAAAALPGPGPWGLLAAFVLFRVLDIAKPGPVGWADRRAGPGAIMADDLLAGGIAALLILAGRWMLRG